MAKGGHRRPSKRKKTYKRDSVSNETKNFQRVKDRKKQARKSKSLVRQMRGRKWDEEEYLDEVDELDEIE
jgi:hypothetical protein